MESAEGTSCLEPAIRTGISKLHTRQRDDLLLVARRLSKCDLVGDQQSLPKEEYASTVRALLYTRHLKCLNTQFILSPDKNPGVKGIHERFARLGVITAILRDPEGRKRYDFFFKNGVPKWRGVWPDPHFMCTKI